MSSMSLPYDATNLSSAQSLGVARTLRIFASETRYELLRALRTRTYSFSVIGFPVMFYLLFGLLMNRNANMGGISASQYLLGGYAVFGAISAALFGVGVGLGGDLHAGWVELKRASPMPPLALLLAKCVVAMCFAAGIVCTLTIMGIAIGHVSISVATFAKMLGVAMLGTIPFASCALLIALIVPANSAPGVTNLINLPMSFLGGLWLPISLLPNALQKIAPLFPTYHLGQLMFGTLGYSVAGSASAHWISLLGFALLMLGLAWIAFRRRESNS